MSVTVSHNRQIFVELCYIFYISLMIFFCQLLFVKRYSQGCQSTVRYQTTKDISLYVFELVNYCHCFTKYVDRSRLDPFPFYVVLSTLQKYISFDFFLLKKISFTQHPLFAHIGCCMKYPFEDYVF